MPERNGAMLQLAPALLAALAAKAQTASRTANEARGWSLLDWAIHAGVDWHTTSDYANGRTNPYRSTRLKLATALGLSVHDLPK